MSLGFGLISLASTLIATYLETLRGVSSSYLLDFLNKVGFISEPSQKGVAEMKASSALALTDTTALIGLLSYGIYLAVIAMLFAIWSEAKEEDALYSAVGFILSSAAMVCYSFSYGLPIAGIGVVALFVVRRRKRLRRVS